MSSERSAKPAAANSVSQPEEPAKPNWPVNEKPNPAQVTWDAHGLRVEASNSSLIEILHAVGTDTGARITGLGKDERVFGTYGPGPARQVISQLLDGTGYNVMIIGDQGGGAPRAIELSPSSPGGTAPQTAVNKGNSGADDATPDDSDNGNEEFQPPAQPEYQPPMPPAEGQPPQPQPIRNPFGSGEPPRSPQQILQQMQQQQPNNQ